MNDPKKETKVSKKTKNNSIKAGEIFLTGIVFGIVGASLIGGFGLMGLVQLPSIVSHWVGAILIAYVLLGGIVITHLCVKQILVKKG